MKLVKGFTFYGTVVMLRVMNDEYANLFDIHLRVSMYWILLLSDPGPRI